MSSPVPHKSLISASFVWVVLLILAAVTTLICGSLVVFTKHSQDQTVLDNLGLYSGITATVFLRFAGGRMQRHQHTKTLYYIGLGIFGAAVLTFIATTFV